jgi:hypothetical protein
MPFHALTMAYRHKNDIKCIQINLMRSKTSTAHLCQHIIDNNIDIALIQEPYTIRGTVSGFPTTYTVLYQKGCALPKRPKSAIVITNSAINSVYISSHSNEWLTITTISFTGHTCALISAYFSPDNDINSELNHIKNAINSINKFYVIFSADTNSHSNVWFDSRNDRRGEEVLEFMAENDLILLNDNRYIPTFETIRGQTE